MAAQYTTHIKSGYLRQGLLEQRENALSVEVSGIDDATTFGEIATEFIIEPRDPTRLDLNSHASFDEESVELVDADEGSDAGQLDM